MSQPSAQQSGTRQGGRWLLVLFCFSLGVLLLASNFNLSSSAEAAGPNPLLEDPGDVLLQNIESASVPSRVDLNLERPPSDSQRPGTPGTKGSSALVYPIPTLERVELRYSKNGDLLIPSLPSFATQYAGASAALNQRGEYVFFSVQPALQQFVESVVKKVRDPHVAIVVMEPHSGRVLAMADKSTTIPSLALHAGFPAASLFKLVTAAATLEHTELDAESLIAYRGGTYTLNQWNFRPDARRDQRRMPLAEALGKSCNPVFGRLALNYLSSSILRRYSQNFGFNTRLGFDALLPESKAFIPDTDYEVSLTGAGFGDVTISPVHAAAIASGIGNHGLMPRPSFIDRVVDKAGRTIFQSKTSVAGRLVLPSTALELLRMMESTTTEGTSRKEFIHAGRQLMPGVSVAAKTGTLRGDHPKGINNWFIAVAPIEDPQVAISVIVVDPNYISTKASHLGRIVLEFYLRGQITTPSWLAPPAKAKSKSSYKKKQSYKKPVVAKKPVKKTSTSAKKRPTPRPTPRKASKAKSTPTAKNSKS